MSDMEKIRNPKWAVVSPDSTPKHLRGVKLFDTEQEARDFGAKPEWRHCRIEPATDCSAFARLQEAERAREQDGPPKESYADIAHDQHCRHLRGLPPRKPRKDRKGF